MNSYLQISLAWFWKSFLSTLDDKRSPKHLRIGFIYTNTRSSSDNNKKEILQLLSLACCPNQRSVVQQTELSLRLNSRRRRVMVHWSISLCTCGQVHSISDPSACEGLNVYSLLSIVISLLNSLSLTGDKSKLDWSLSHRYLQNSLPP